MKTKEVTTRSKRASAPSASRAWWHYIKPGNLIFGLIIFALGLGGYFVPVPFGVKDLLSGAVVGAGVAIIVAEFTFAFERRGSEENQRTLTEQNENLLQNIDILKSSITKPQLYQYSHLFSLGTSLALIQWQKVEDKGQLENLHNHMMNLAGVLGVREAVDKFINQPDLQAPQAMHTFVAVRDAVRLRYPREGTDTYVTGYTLASWICGVIGNLSDSTLATVRKGILALNLRLDVENYIEDSLLTYKAGKCPVRNLIGFLSLVGMYIDQQSHADNPDIAAFFEKDHLSIDQETTVQRMQTLLQMAAASG